MESNFTIGMYGKNSTKSVLEPAVFTYSEWWQSGGTPWGSGVTNRSSVAPADRKGDGSSQTKDVKMGVVPACMVLMMK